MKTTTRSCTVFSPRFVQLKYLCVLFLGCWLIWAINDPQALVVLLGANLLYASLMFLARYKLLPEVKSFSKLCLVPKDSKHGPLISVHIPVGNHSYLDVMKTLHSVMNLTYKNAEIILVGQIKTQDLPTEFKNLSKTFKLKVHSTSSRNRGKLLNTSLSLTNKDADYIFLVEPGRELQSHTLSKGLEYILQGNSKAFIQYALAPIERPELKACTKFQEIYYDQTFAQAGTEHNVTLMYGDLTLVDKNKLIEIAGWVESENDCELRTGLKLNANGFKGFHLNTQMSSTECAYKIKIRNYLRLRSMFWSLTLEDFKGLNFQQSLVVLLQLTPWQNFITIPLSLFALKALNLYYPEFSFTALDGSTFIAGTTIIGSFYFHILFLLQKLSMSVKTPHIFGLFFTNLASYFESAKALQFFNMVGRTFLPQTILRYISFSILIAVTTAISYKLIREYQDISALTPITTTLVILIGVYLSKKRKEQDPTTVKGQDTTVLTDQVNHPIGV